MDNRSFRAQHQIFSHLFLGFVERAAATSLLPDKLCFLTNWKPWDIDQAQPEGCAVLFCWLLPGFCRLLGVHRNSLAQPQGQPWERLPHVCHQQYCQPNLVERLQELFNRTECAAAWSHLPVPLSFTSGCQIWWSFWTSPIWATWINTSPIKRLKPAGTQDSWLEKLNNPVWCFYLQAGR